MKKYLAVLVLAGFLFVPAISHADTYCGGYDSYCSAKIIYKSNTCQYYVAEYNYNQFAIFDWMGGNILTPGDWYYGTWNGLSMGTVFNLSQYGNPTSQVFMAASMVSNYNLVSRYYTYCPEG